MLDLERTNMTENSMSLEVMIAKLDQKKLEIDELTKQINAMMKQEMDKSKLHSRRILKQGMEAFFAGNSINPYEYDSEDAELWSFGFNISKDNWDEMKK